MFNSFNTFTKTLILDRSSFKFGIGVWLGLSFSIAVILSTIGIMDGFSRSMREGLQNSMGDLYFYSRSGFFELNENQQEEIESLGLKNLTGYIESQAFLVFKENSKGISIKGVDGEKFSSLSGMDIHPKAGELIIGSELAKQLSIKVGDELVIVLAKGNKELDGLPSLRRFKVQGIAHHGIYQKDLRFVYMNLAELSLMLGVDHKVNVYAVNVNEDQRNAENFTDIIEDYRFQVEDMLGIDYRVKPFWYDFGSLLEAVEIQKITIGLILQVIVVVSIFNVLAFITFLDEKRSREIFLFQALGMGPGQLRMTWYGLIIVLWLLSCLFSLVLVEIFDYALQNLTILQLPGDVYSLAQLKLSLSFNDYILVFLSALFWLFLIISFALYRMTKKSILSGLREEFA